jgi:hypothetical protein
MITNERILGKIRRRQTLDKNFMNDCASYDAMESLTWDLPKGLAVHEWVRKRVSTDAHDVLKTATNLFDVHHPKWEILPRGPVDADKAEELERWLEWQMLLANRHGDQEPFRQMLKHSTKYNRITVQLDYLPYWLTDKNSEEWKEAVNNPFCIKVHSPCNVRYEMGSYGPRWVASVSNVPAAEVIDHWDAYQDDGKYGKKIAKAIRKIEELLKDNDEARVMYVDYTDREKRWVFAYEASTQSVDDKIEAGDNVIEIVNGENELGFINWVISVGTSDPLLFSLHHGGLWENQCFLDTITDSIGIRRGFFPLIKHTSASGKTLEVDYTGAEAVMELNASDGETAEVMMPPPLDPGIRELMDRNSQKGASATGLKGLQNMNVVGNVQFASVNAMIQVSKSTLDPYIRNFEGAAVELGRLAFLWIHKSGDTITGYRTKNKNVQKNKVKGQKINIGKDDFDPKTMVIQCELLSNTPSDEMQRMNVYSQAVQIGLPIPKKQIVERMDWGEGDVLEADYLKEKIQEIALGVFGKMQEGQVEMLLQQMQQQMQNQQSAISNQQSQPPPQALPPGGQAGMPPPEQMGGAAEGMMPEGAANDPNAGGAPPAMGAPQMTQTATRRP